jgi:metallophosphoesterase superfamily enzyme
MCRHLGFGSAFRERGIALMTMNYVYLKLVAILQSTMTSEEGQDLVE